MKRITFKQFLEQAPDKDFIKMMNGILGDIPELKQREAEFQKKITDIAKEVPQMFQKQRDLEKWMSAAVGAVKQIPNTMMKDKLHELGGVLDEYIPGISFLDILGFHIPFYMDHQKYKELVKRGEAPEHHRGNPLGTRNMQSDDDKWMPICLKFIKKHGDDIEDCIRAVEHGFDAIREMANKEHWPAPWQRYGALPSEKHMFTRTQEELIYWIKELKNIDLPE